MFYLIIVFNTKRGTSERFEFFSSFLKYIFRHKLASFCCFSLQIFTLYYPRVIIIPFLKQKQAKTEPEVNKLRNLTDITT